MGIVITFYFKWLILTSNEHDADWENLLWVGVGGYIPESYAGQAAKGEIEGRYILILDGGSWARDWVVVRFPELISQSVEPTDGSIAFYVANGIPNACQPVGNEGKGAHEKEEHSSAIFWIAVQFPGYSHQSQQACRFQ